MRLAPIHRLPLRSFVVAASALIALPAAAQSLDVPSGTYKADPTHTSIVWKLNHLGFSSYTGMFERSGIDATIELDAADVANSSVTATIKGEEIQTLHPVAMTGKDFNAEVAGEKFINATAHPTISFESTGIEVTGENTANITGNLTFNNETHPLVLETTLNRAADHPMAGTPTLGISATATVDRTQWGVNALAGPIGTEVTVEIESEFQLVE
ncbi:MAG: YceI family protein [Pseudomonadota bacterium]